MGGQQQAAGRFVLAAILGSLIGAAGTIAGMVIGSMASGTWSWWAEGGIRRTRRRPGRSHPRPGGTAVPRRRWSGPAALIAAAFIGCAIVVTLLEGAAGKPLSAVVQGKPGHGTTLGGGAVAKAAPASPSPAPPTSRPATALQQPARRTR